MGIDHATEPADRTKTVSKNCTQQLTGLSGRTVDHMIADGRAEQPQAAV
jgi:hypothetical protein